MCYPKKYRKDEGTDRLKEKLNGNRGETGENVDNLKNENKKKRKKLTKRQKEKDLCIQVLFLNM